MEDLRRELLKAYYVVMPLNKPTRAPNSIIAKRQGNYGFRVLLHSEISPIITGQGDLTSLWKCLCLPEKLNFKGRVVGQYPFRNNLNLISANLNLC